MEYKRQKKIRKLLISYINDEIKNNKRKKKEKILINSTPLEQLEKKNLKCKEFIIQERTQTYENVDNNRSIVQLICINNKSFCRNIVIFPLSQRIINNTIKKDININDNMYKNNTIDENDSENNFHKVYSQKNKKFLFSQKIINLESPVEQIRFIKKELGERKLKRTKNDYNIINNNPYIFFNKEDSIDKICREKENNKDKENDDNINEKEKDKERAFSKQLSIITLATDVSRIIKVCHNEVNLSGIEQLNSDSKIYDELEDIKKAKKYAKKLKLYCRTLKNKFPNTFKTKKSEAKLNQISINDIKYKNKDINISHNEREEFQEKEKEKKNFRKFKKKDKKSFNYNDIISQKRFCKKKHSEKINVDYNLLNKINNDENNKFLKLNKKIKSERNIKLNIDKNTFLNTEDNNLTDKSISTNYQQQYKTIENNSKNKNNSNFINENKKMKKKSKEDNKSIFKSLKESIKLKSPVKKKKKEIALNYKKIKNKINNLFQNENNCNKRGSKKILLKKIISNNDSQKNENTFTKKNKKRRISIEPKIKEDDSSLEPVFLATKNLSTSEQLNIIKKNKKKILVEKNSKNYNTINNQENSEFINKVYKHINKKKKGELSKIENKQESKEKKTKDHILKKIKTTKYKMKRNTYNFIEKNFNPNNKNINNKRRLSPIINEEKIIHSTFDAKFKKIENKKKINIKLNIDKKNYKNESSNIEETNDTIELDKYIYKKKYKKIKNNLK